MINGKDNKMKLKNITLLISIVFVVISCIDNNTGDDKKLVSKIDHILIEPDDSFAFFNFLSKDLDLPIVWDYQDYGSFVTGGVFCGNVNIESLSYDKLDAESTISGIAFDPYLSTGDTIIEMDKCLISHSEPLNASYGKVTAIENLLPKSYIFFCEYLNAEEVESKRKIKQKELEERNGGTLGIEYVIDVTIYVDSEALINEWKKLIHLDENFTNDYTYNESSPNIHFIKSDRNSIYSIKFKVKSIKDVNNYLVQNNMFGSEAGGIISTDPENTYGVLFKFSEN